MSHSADDLTPWAKNVVLPTVRGLCGCPAAPIRAGLIADHLGLKRRQTYNYLADLEEAGLIRKASPKRWITV